MSPGWRVAPEASRDAGSTDYEKTTLVQAANSRNTFGPRTNMIHRSTINRYRSTYLVSRPEMAKDKDREGCIADT